MGKKENYMPLVGRRFVYMEKKNGGLGIRNLEIMNDALIGRVA